jgi:hypothetical protein
MMNIKQRRLMIRGGLVCVWIALGVIIFILNRGHTVLVDNRNIAALNIRAPDLIKVSVDNSKAVEFFRGDRDLFDVGGGGHKIRIEFSDGTPPFEAAFPLPLKHDMYLLSIPRLINGIEPYIEVFETEPDPPRETEAIPAEVAP